MTPSLLSYKNDLRRLSMLFSLSIFVLSEAPGQLSDWQFKPAILPRELPAIDCIFEDSQGQIWIGTYGGLFLYDGYEMEHFANEPKDSNSLGDNKIRCMIEQLDGNLWIGTQTGLHYLDVRTRKFKRYDHHETGIGAGVNALQRDSSGIVWAATHAGVYKIIPGTADRPSEIKKVFTKPGIFEMTLGIQNDLWFSDGDQLFRKASDGEEFSEILIFRNSSFYGERISFLYSDHAGRIWINTDLGIHQYDLEGDSIRQFIPWPTKGIVGAQNAMTEIKKDCFIAASNDYFYELNLLAPGLKQIPLNISTNNADEKVRLYVTEMNQTRNGMIWLSYNADALNVSVPGRNYFQVLPTDLYRKFVGPGSYFELYDFYPGQLLIPNPGGHRLLNYRTGEFSNFTFQPDFEQDKWNGWLTAFDEQENGLLWIGSDNGVFLLDKKTSQFINLKALIKDFGKLDGQLVRDIMEDSRKNVWVLTWAKELFRIDQVNQKVIRYDSLKSDPVLPDGRLGFRAIYQDRDHKIWIGSRSGLLQYNDQTDSFKVYQYLAGDPQSMSENTSFCIFQDTLGYIWSGSYGGGLNRLDTSTGKFRHFTVQDGLLENNIFSLIPDNQDNLWLVSYDGITRFNPYTFEMIHVTYQNGLGSKNYNAFLYGKSMLTGELFLMGNNSVDIFHPDSFHLSSYKPPVIFTDFQLFNEPVPIGLPMERDPLKFYLDQHISWTEALTLPYDQKVITIDYVALDYSGSGNIQYAYQLVGFDNAWQYVGKKRSVTYTNLDPGKYEFRVKATNADGVWNEEPKSLYLAIMHPWWATHGAYALYAILFGSLLYGIYYYQKRRWALQTALQLQEQESGRLKELDVLKTNLYTNITHEFRTPLTVISGMVDLIRNQPKEWLQKGTVLIDEQNEKLLTMVNQMLDLQRIEAGKMTLDLIQSDIISFINYLAEPFQFIARSKHLDLSIQHQSDLVVLDFDPDKLAQIISNLLSNAIKYTQKGLIILSTQENRDDVFEISIKDTGIGIAEDKLPFIFDRFYQTDQGSTRRGEGSGIGLALVKELLQLMNGEIKVQSRISEGSVFSVLLKITKTAAFHDGRVFLPEKAPVAHADQLTVTDGITKDRKERILIIEDNADVRRYLRALLVSEFQIMEAVDGVDGIHKSIQLVPDLIISDVMMPGKDGYAVCDALHQHPLTSHIPVILLTARADTSSKIKGYHRGADVYLTKPFHPDELKAQISMLLEQRKRLHEVYQRELGNGTPQPKNVFRADPFMVELHTMVLSDLSNEELDITRICKSMHVSRSQLHNKIKATTGYSTSIFIRKLRLQEARKLILNSTLHISEIAYQTGFKDPNFFSRVYKQEFGESPKEGRG